jgi:hypothetical protein
MPSVDIRQFRNTRRLKAWLAAGKTVELREGNQILGRILPEPASPKRSKWPDFAKRAKKIFGDRVMPAVDIVIEERGRY